MFWRGKRFLSSSAPLNFLTFYHLNSFRGHRLFVAFSQQLKLLGIFGRIHRRVISTMSANKIHWSTDGEKWSQGHCFEDGIIRRASYGGPFVSIAVKIDRVITALHGSLVIGFGAEWGRLPFLIRSGSHDLSVSHFRHSGCMPSPTGGTSNQLFLDVMIWLWSLYAFDICQLVQSQQFLCHI